MSQSISVIGGGVVGLCSAIAMQRLGFATTVYDANALCVEKDETSPRVYAINHASERLLRSLNVWEHLQKERICPYQQMQVWDEKNGASIDFDTRTIACEKLGTMIDEANLRAALLRVATHEQIRLMPNTKIKAIQTTEHAIEIVSEKERARTDFLIIADGANSFSRTLLGILISQWPYHQHALIAKVNTEKPHQRTAYQVFRKEGTLAFLPLHSPYQCSIVWSSTQPFSQQLMVKTDAEFNQTITDVFANKLGSVTLASERQQFPLHMRHVKQYYGNRWLIMGDAAHTIHPLAGLGLNLGLADVSTLSKLLQENQHPLFTNKLLNAYQRNRKQDVWQTIALMEGIKALFLNPLSPIAALRGLGLSLCNQFTPLKRLFIEHAAGL